MNAAPSRKKQPIQVETTGSLARADFTGLARLLLRINQQTDLKVVKAEKAAEPCPTPST
jgi:hypothetical protein